MIQPLKANNNIIVSAADSIDYIINKYGDMSAAKDTYFINQYNAYLKINQPMIDKAYAAITASYNPLDNNDVISETVTLNKQDKVEMKPTAAKDNTYNKSYDGGLEKVSYTENEIVSAAESTPNNTLSESFQDTTETGYNATSKTLERKHGNISAVTNQSIIEQEMQLRLKYSMFDFIDKAVIHGGVYYDN